MGLVISTFDLLTLEQVNESHQRWGTFIPNLGMLGLRVLELFAMYATDGRTDEGQKQSLLPLLYGRGHNYTAVTRGWHHGFERGRYKFGCVVLFIG